MKKIFLLITLFVSVSFLLKAQIPNPSFENWDTINNYCNGWYSLNDAFGASNTTRESISTDGNYSIGLQSVNIPGFGIAPGLATTGELNTLTNTIGGGYATNERPDSMIGYIRETNLSGDTSSALVIVTHHGTTSQEIGRGGIYFTGTTTGFRRFSFPIDYTSTLSTDTILIILTAGSLQSTSAGSKVYFDQLSFKTSYGVGINNINKQNIQIFQLDNQLVIENIADNSTLRLVDINGNILSQNETTINTNTYSNGMYFLQVSNPSYETFTKKVIIQH